VPADREHVDTDNLTLTARDVMRITGFSENFTYQALLDGRIPGRIQCGRRVLVSRRAFEQWLSGAAAGRGGRDGA
jgi:predicted DNA-binding transcriptional regulator AlpA